MQRKISLVLAIVFMLSLSVFTASANETWTANQIKNINGIDYEYWKDSGNGTMRITGTSTNGSFSCEWSNINNILFRSGRKWNSRNQTHSQIGNISMNYNVSTWNVSGNSYLCIYGWTVDPLVEWYIIERHGSYKPGGSRQGTLSVDGGTYELSRTTRTNQPSILGTRTFDQYWSIRTSGRSSGTVSVSQHFRAWENQGWRLGNLTEVALTVEGWQNQGNATVSTMNLSVGGSSGGGSTPATTTAGSSGGGSGGGVNANGRMEAENMTKGGQHTGNISSPFNGVRLYANDDRVSFNQNFANNSHNFTLRGRSTSSNEAQVRLSVGGTNSGTFRFNGTTVTNSTLTVNHNRGGSNNVAVELRFINDRDGMDVDLDWLEITAASGGSTGGGNTTTTTTRAPAATTTAASGGGSGTATRVTAQSMTKAGQYTGNISSPFNGVRLYANDDRISFNQNFANNRHQFTLRGRSTASATASVRLEIGGTNSGTFSFSGTTVSNQNLTVSHNRGGQNNVTVTLRCVNDNNTWDADIEWIEIRAA